LSNDDLGSGRLATVERRIVGPPHPRAQAPGKNHRFVEEPFRRRRLPAA
jgi:hypothetical protein